MTRQQGAYDAHQLARLMRPDAARWIRSDAARFLKSGASLADAFPGVPGLEKKYGPDQPRDDHGRWTDGGRLGSVSSSTRSGLRRDVTPAGHLIRERRLETLRLITSFQMH